MTGIELLLLWLVICFTLKYIFFQVLRSISFISWLCCTCRVSLQLRTAAGQSSRTEIVCKVLWISFAHLLSFLCCLPEVYASPSFIGSLAWSDAPNPSSKESFSLCETLLCWNVLKLKWPAFSCCVCSKPRTDSQFLVYWSLIQNLCQVRTQFVVCNAHPLQDCPGQTQAQ